ncbi:MAG TPA: glycerol-3-phosphate 1-O-acyltransferase PlsY [Opitutaceae bacterium]|nr:glycerol-3-phosphate 1-O-acyltransferase PlsY [Opitutaceae bacterium]
MVLALVIAALVGYLFGSLPFGWLIARMRGVNIFEVGSRSAGATNVRRVLGAGAGNTVFALDLLKGAAAAAWPLAWAAWSGWPEGVGPLRFCLISLVAALIGHSFSCFTGFRGGKGVATGTGGFLVLLPIPLLIAAAIWVVAFYATGYVSLASILAALTLPTAAYLHGDRSLLITAAAVVSLFVIIRHRTNIARLLRGTENKFVKRKDGAP